MTALPELDGIAFLTFRGPADYPALVRIINASAFGEGGERVETVEGLASGYTSSGATRRATCSSPRPKVCRSPTAA